MENRLVFSMRCCSLFLLFLALSCRAAAADDDETNDLFSPIYFGDSTVNVGEPFKINCRISISTPTEWLKDGESIVRHNLRHGRDEHSYIVTESEIEGERDKTLSTLSVKHALLVHRGKYQCNKDHSNYFELTVNDNEKPTTTVSQYELKNTSQSYKINKMRGYHPGSEDGSSAAQDLIEWDLNDPNSMITTEMYAKNRKSNLNFEKNIGYMPETLQNTNLQRESKIARNNDVKNSRKNTIQQQQTEQTNGYADNDNDDEEDEEEDTLRIFPSAAPKFRHNKGFHKNTDLSTVTSPNYVASITQPSKSRKAGSVVAQYDNVEHKLKSFEIRFPLVLSCNVTGSESPNLEWRKNGTNVARIDSLKGRYRTIDKEGKFVIDRTEENDAGHYECYNDALKASADFNVYANVAVRVPSNVAVVEGEKLTIHCTVVGSEPVVTWSIGNLTINETTNRYNLKEDDNKLKNAIITVEGIVLDDRGEFKCTATNPATEYGNADPASDTTMVRVKGKLAALWPFIGICAEVFFLCAIILIYEKRRNKTELDESDTDPNTEQKKKRRNYD